ncbi:hypothetical protein [Brachybacterium hainanense]|uniref:DUF624 domain-containing protein n=1 Tax=Brachybacterium hainanense TaxID=1541174 RepID=A0ABV6R6S3_9MICO
MTTSSGDYRPGGWLRAFAIPGAVIASNAAALLGALSIIGLAPGLSGSARVLGSLAEHGDEAFRTVLRHLRATWLRDLPVTAGIWLVLLAVAGNILVLPVMDPSLRTFAVGAMLPLGWVLVAFASAYVTLAADPEAARADLVLGAGRLLVTRPLRALLAPAAVIALSPLWLLAPLTIACGLAVPPYLLTALWGGGPSPDQPADPATRTGDDPL